MGNNWLMSHDELQILLEVVIIALLVANMTVTAWIGFKAWYAVIKAVELIGVAKEVLETAQEYGRVTKEAAKETERVVKETVGSATEQAKLNG